ncbi:MAG: pyocin knob domain-containing protein [Prevotellaceae bacterium]|nr:pyocin knob domain-containing protein [Prevotellaceae bacterium]
MSQQNTALIDDIMAALDAESSQNVELIVRNTQNGATKKMALASLEQIIYSYLTTAPVVSNLASVLGVPKTGSIRSSDDFNNYVDSGVWGYNAQIVGQLPSANSPGSSYKLGSLIVFHPVGTSAGGGNPVVQIYVQYNCSAVFIRTKWVNEWSGWKQVAFNIPSS